MGADVEIELKLHVPTDRLADVRRAVDATRVHRLEAVYLDSVDDHLAAAGLAWRLRCEDGNWIQTLKARGDGTVVRFEHEVPRPGPHRPAPDPSCHAHTAIGSRLAGILADGTVTTARFTTAVERRVRIAREGTSTVELALDVGRITAGERAAEICELEIELVDGNVGDIVATARHWLDRHGLWIDTVTKSQLGTALAGDRDVLPVARRVSSRPGGRAGRDTAVRRVVAGCLAGIMPNTSALTHGLGGPEHLRMARIGLRGLRTALVVGGRDRSTVDPTWVDRTTEILDALHPSVADAAAGVVTSAAFGHLALDLLAFAHGTPVDDGELADRTDLGRFRHN